MAIVNVTSATGNSDQPAVAVPTGAAIGHVAVLICSADNSGWSMTSRVPTSFLVLREESVTADGQRVIYLWKRLTAADTGSYTFTAGAGAAADWNCGCVLLSGRHATNPAVISAASIQNTGQTNPVTVSGLTVTAVAGDDVVFGSCPDVSATGIGNGHSSWSASYTEQIDVELGFTNLGIAVATNVSAGATGTKTTSFALTGGNAGWSAALIRVPAAAGAGNSRTASESISISDAASRSPQSLARTASEAVGSISDSSVKTDAYTRTAAEAVGAVTDVAVGVVGPTRTASESISGPSDSLARGAQALLRNLAESISISDADLGVKHFARTASESVSGPSDSATRVAAFSRTTIDPGGLSGPWLLIQVTSPTNTIGIGDSVSGLAGKGRTASEAVGVSDALTRTLVLPRAITESIGTIADSVVRTLVQARVAVESIPVSESVARAFGLSRVASESIVVGDLLARDAQALARAVVESISIFDELDSSSTGSTSRSVSEFLAILDAATRAPQTFDRDLDAVNISIDDSLLGGNLQNVTASESLAVSDAATRTASLVRLLGETILVDDAVTRPLVLHRVVDEAISIVDAAVVGSPAANRIALESLSISDSVAVTLGLVRSASEVIIIFDTMGRQIYGQRPQHPLVASSAPALFGTGSLSSRPA